MYITNIYITIIYKLNLLSHLYLDFDTILEDISENKLNNEFKTTISLFKLKKILREVDSEAYLIKRKEQEQETLNKLKSLR